MVGHGASAPLPNLRFLAQDRDDRRGGGGQPLSLSSDAVLAL